MPYLIAVVILVVGAVAFTFVRTDLAATPDVAQDLVEARPPEETDLSDNSETATTNDTSDPSVVSEVVDGPRPSDPDLTEFVDGTYTTQTSYFTPRRTEHTMDVTFTLEDDVVTDVSILWDGAVEPKTPSHTGFDEAYKAEVVGQPLNEIYLSRVGGASLTSESFNEAVQTVEAEASAS